MAYTFFKTPIGYRLYDREVNKIVPLHEDEYLALKRIKQGEEKGDDLKILQNMQQNGFCCNSSLQEIEHPATHTAERILNSKIQQVVLQVTQNCNLRCSYCAYSGKYFNRQHTSKRMSLQTAMSAIDFVMRHSFEVKELVIGFYGGEPVLEFELIKKVIEYVETQYPGRNVRFNFTTNLTLFSDEVIEYILEKKIDILISLDGPKDVQDKYRVFANGEGSYKVVQKNAKKMRDRSPERFKRFGTNTVVSPNENYEKIRDFLDNDELFGPLNSMLSLVNESGLKENIYYDDSYYKMVRREKFKVLLYMLGEISPDRISRTFLSEKASVLLTYHELNHGGTGGSRKAHPDGPCVPGVKRLFVDVEGNFYPCERISELKRYQIGNIYSGFTMPQIKKILNVGVLTKEECINCWAFMFCSTCIASMIEGQEPTKKMRLSKCQMIKESVMGRLSDLEIIKHYGFDFSEEGSNSNK